jgi:hypothetical protein
MARTLTLLISEFLFYKLSISEIHSPAFRHFGGVSCAKLKTPGELLQAGQSATAPQIRVSEGDAYILTLGACFTKQSQFLEYFKQNRRTALPGAGSRERAAEGRATLISATP